MTTINQLISWLTSDLNPGLNGDVVIKAYDPDKGEYVPVTGYALNLSTHRDSHKDMECTFGELILKTDD